jgi:hypothetical protein
MTLAGASMLAIPLVLAPAAPPTGPLDAEVVDTSAYPTVLVDFTVPPPLRSLAITVDMVELEGGSVVSVAPVDPAGIVVGLVIDDGPTVPPEIVEQAQGASVELVRNVGTGTKIALSTPSGLQTALTSDRQANISRIAGITAGAPDVMPLAALILDAAARLAESTETDRHLVLVLRSSPTVDLDVLTDVVAAHDIEVHLVAPDGLDLGALAELAASTGGVVPSVPALVGEIDAATAAIALRYRVEAVVDAAGPRELAVVGDGSRHSATVDVVAPDPAPVPVSSVVQTTTTTATPPTAPRSQTVAPTTPTTAVSSAGGGSPTTVLVVVGLVAAAVACAALVLFWRRRGGDEDEVGPAVAVPPQPAQVQPEPDVAPERVTASARAARAAAAARPHRSTNPRRPEPKPDPKPEVEVPLNGAHEGEWLVSGNLRLSPSTGQVWAGRREVSLTPAELGVLELLLRSGDHGVTADAIAQAAHRGVGDGEPVDPDAVLTELRRKIRLPGKTRRVRRERVMLYFFDGESSRG